MRRGSGVQAVERLGDHAHRAVEPDAVVRDTEVGVHGLRHAHHASVLFGQPRGNAQRVVPADCDQRIDVELLEVVQHLIHTMVELHRVHTRAAEHGAAERQDAREPRALEGDHVTLTDQPGPSVANAEQCVAGHERAPADGADRGVEAWRVTAARQDGNPLSHSCLPFCGPSHPPRGHRRTLALRRCRV